MFPERPTFERPQTMRIRSKGGLETPLCGRIWRETRLIFAPPQWYDALTYACLAVGLFAFATALFGGSILIFPASVLIWAGPLVFFSGLWGQMSSERMTCDLRGRTYARREGQGLFKRIIRGSLSELDAIVLVTQQNPAVALTGQMVAYRLVLHWKGNREPLLVVGTQYHSISGGQPINHRAGQLNNDGQRWARMLGIPFYDNSYFHSPEPVRVL